MKLRNIGIDALDDVPWGMHLCLFYQTKKELIEMLVPYFKAGLENNEYCLWITSEPLTIQDAEIALKKAVPNFAKYVQKKQIEIIPHTKWYLFDGCIDWQRTMANGREKLNQALAKGFAGLRSTGDSFCLTEQAWQSTKDYEQELNNVINDHRILAICSYSLEKYGFHRLMDAVSNHQSVLMKSNGKWKKFKSSGQVKIEQELQKSEAKWRSIANCTPDIIMLLDRNANILFINHTSSDLTPDEIVRKSAYDFVTKKDRKKVRDSLKKVLTTGHPNTHEADYIDKAGQVCNFEAHVGPVCENNKITGFVMRVTEITERKKTEHELRLQAEIMSNISEGVYLIGANDLIIRYANPKFEEMFGYDSGEMVGKHVSIVNAPTDKSSEETVTMIKAQLENKGVWHGETNNIKKNGSTFWCYASVSMFDHQKYGKVYVGIHTDITERKQLEKEHAHLQTAKLESLGTLAGGIAHDFNNILTGIMGNISLAKNYISSEEKAYSRLEEAEKASIRAKDLTQQLLTFSKGGLPVKKLMPIRELIKDAVIFALRGSNINPEFSIENNLWATKIDEGQISQVISNLVINAKEAMPEGGILKIKAENIIVKKNNYIKITIKDYGIGIAKKYLNKIFDPYFTTKQQGSGLGLSTTYSIIKNHDGYITVDSIQNEGTTFHIYLPASQKPIAVEKKQVAKTSIHYEGRILVMDDDEPIRNLLQDMLENIGYEVELSQNGTEAVELYKNAKKPFDVVILDLTIRDGMGGKKTIKKLLKIDPKIKAIVSSGYATDTIMAGYKKYGFKDVVVKPYNVSKMEQVLHNILCY